MILNKQLIDEICSKATAEGFIMNETPTGVIILEKGKTYIMLREGHQPVFGIDDIVMNYAQFTLLRETLIQTILNLHEWWLKLGDMITVSFEPFYEAMRDLSQRLTIENEDDDETDNP